MAYNKTIPTSPHFVGLDYKTKDSGQASGLYAIFMLA